jgi:hypothetical protein
MIDLGSLAPFLITLSAPYQRKEVIATEMKKIRLHITEAELINIIEIAAPTTTNVIAIAEILMVSQKV